MSSEPPKWLIDNIAEASINARKLFFIYIGFISYCAITVVSTTDRQLVIGGVVKLPIISVEVGLDGFFIIAPAIAILLFVYFQLYLARLETLKQRLRGEDRGVDELRLYPWMINMVDKPEPGFGGWLQRRFVSFSLWWSLPLLLMLFGLWFLKKHDPVLSYVVGALPMAGAALALYFRLYNENLAKKLAGFLTRTSSWPGRLVMPSFVIVFEAFFLVFIVPRALEGDSYRIFNVDLSFQKLITEPSKGQDYKELYWGNFKGSKLQGANLTSTVLKRADLQKADLREANLWRANLQGADLESANLGGAKLREANLREAYLWEANLMEANLQGADLESANLGRAKNLTVEQLSKVKTLYNVKGLAPKLMEAIKKDYPHLLRSPFI